MVPIRLENLTKRYATRRGEVLAVDDVSLSIEGGELFFLLGPSGCGKTTLLRALAGFVQPTAGRIFFGDRDITDDPPERRDAAMVFQNYALWPHMTVRQNVAFGPKMRHVPRAESDQLVLTLLETVRIAEKASAKPMELSGGQQQRVALARALAARPRCLLLDEPLSNLDAALRAAMRWEIRRIVKSAGATAVYVTHDQAEALAIADRIALMHRGRIAQIGTGRELYEAPASRFVASFLGDANFIDATVASVEGKALRLDTPLGTLLGRSAAAVKPGQKVTCCIRPEMVEISPSTTGPAAAGNKDANTCPARLTEWVHLGDSARFELACPGGVTLHGAVMPPRAVAAAGETVGVRFSPDGVIVLAE
jgi:iron(III) transport system ATP-binding protein